MRTVEEIVHDLRVIEQYFIDTSGGAAPMCLEEAITLLTNSEKNSQEVKNECL